MKFKINPLLLVAATVAAASSANADSIWTGAANNNWNDAENWDDLGGIPDGSGLTAVFDGTGSTVELHKLPADGPTTVGTLRFTSGNWNLALITGSGSSRSLVLNNGAENAAVFEVQADTTVTVDGSLNSGTARFKLNTGPVGFNKTGAGTLSLISGRTGLAGSGLVSVSGGILNLAHSFHDNEDAPDRFTGSFQVNEGGTLAFNNGSLGPYSGNITMNGGTLRWNSGNTENIASRLVMVDDKTSTLDIVDENDVVSFAAFNSSAGNVVKAGSGSLVITGNHQGTGVLRVSGGTLILSNTNGNANFQGTYQVDAGAILSVGNDNSVGNLYNGTFAGTRSVVLNGGTLLYNRPNSASLTVLNAAVTGNGTVSVIGGTAGFGQVTGGTIGGSANFILQSGNATLSQDNTYSGTTTITAGTLRVGNGGTSGSLGSGDVLNNASLIFDRSNDFSVANNISGDGTLTKLGAGIQTLTGTNTYTGDTTVSGGTLLVNGSLGVTAVTVGADGILGGTGSIVGELNVTGVLAPGASIESLASGALTMNAGSTFSWEANFNDSGKADLMIVIGALSLTDVVLDLNGANLASALWAVDTKLTLFSYTGAEITDGFTDYDDDTDYAFGGNTWRIDYNDDTAGTNFEDEATGERFVTLTLVAVPEPSVALLGVLGGLLMFRRHRN